LAAASIAPQGYQNLLADLKKAPIHESRMTLSIDLWDRRPVRQPRLAWQILL